MKQILQIVGSEFVKPGIQKDQLDAVFKITCIPFTTEQVKLKKPSLLDMAMGGGGTIQELMQQAESHKTNQTIFYITLEEWLDIFRNKLLTKIEVDVKPVLFHEGKYKEEC